ncbi:hypothetical protein MMC14_005347 [Varicellaria rhodocarpa]|nr:hypothetical protein [Varicellaria rhodocarpa]
MKTEQRPTGPSNDKKPTEDRPEGDLNHGLPRDLPRGAGPHINSALLPSQVSPAMVRSMSRSTEGGVKLEPTTANDGRPFVGGTPSSRGFPQGPYRSIAPLEIHGAFGAHSRDRMNNTGSPISPILGMGHVGNLGSPRAFASHSIRPSVKHLTCYYWKKVGKCRFSEEECLYSHKNTGQLAEAPQKVEPGGKSTTDESEENATLTYLGPSVAGRNLTQLTKAIAIQEHQGIDLRPGWSHPGPDWRPRPNSGSLAFRSPRRPFVNANNMGLTYGNPEVTLPLEKLQQVYSTLLMIQQATRKEVEAIKHECETAFFIADAIKDGISHPTVTADMVRNMASKFETIQNLLQDIDKKVDEAKQAMNTE